MALKNIANKIFRKGLQSVLPRSLILNSLTVTNNELCVAGCSYTLKNNVYVVGFGKAVLGMAVAVDEVLNSHIQDGLLSVPLGSNSMVDEANKLAGLSARSKIVAREGAKDNIPDEAALRTSLEIEKLVKALDDDDILIVLISGGGSALLPAPVKGITLNDKVSAIKLLAANGATIQELNTVRKHLSRLKGGKLASMTGCKSVISLILSDIVGDPLDLIASGPTVTDHSTPGDCMEIIRQHNLGSSLPKTVMAYLSQKEAGSRMMSTFQPTSRGSPFSNVSNIIVGSNRIAVKNCAKAAKDNGFQPFVLSNELTGNVTDVSKSFADIISWFIYDIEPHNIQFFDHNIIKDAYEAFQNENNVCLISAGETTVNVRGSGKGGRNQELTLRTAELVGKYCKETNFSDDSRRVSFCFLSAGTDGQDGPTPAAGALFMGNIFDKARNEGLNMRLYIQENASYDFFSKLDNGSNLVITGLTGTNVMDIQILLLQRL